MTATATVANTEGDLIARREGACGVIRLNRPKAINAVTLEMFRDVDKALDAFEADPAVAVILLEGAGERGLCAGGDIRALWEDSKVGGDLGKILWREEYILNARIAKFPKPYVAFMDGIVMGGGVGLSAHSRHRVVTERTKLAMPEVGLGFFPDVGGTWLLSHSPGERDSNQVQPTSGKKPRPTSGIASLVRSVTTRWLPCADSPTPPPITIPSMKAT